MPPPIITHAGELLSRYDVIFCDVWGVLHDGHHAFEAACDALLRFRAGGGTVILVSNAPVPGERVAAMLDTRAVPRNAYDGIVASGEIALRHIADKGYRRLHCIGPRDRDAATFTRLTAERTGIDEADAILCTGLNDDLNETADDYRPILERARARSLPFVCANPDLVVDVGGRQYLCAGAIADLYERMDGEVFWAGKPHANAYDAARAAAEELRSAPVDRSRIIAVGDSLRTDLKGAEAAGIDAIFVASGIHRDEVMGGTTLDAAKLEVLFAPPAPPALAVMERLAW
ncbi:MAG: TIGR01459 family HAD-type hydrolase [Hyphomicrobium sp.]|jgi:HAD superfamily hydrolase (TIGR01459 family)